MKNVNWFKLIIYISLVFLTFGLYKADYLVIPEIHSYYLLISSFVLMFAGFISMCYNWKVILANDEIVDISAKDTIVSNGLSIFTKYIPGKIMVVLGRAIYISKKYNVSLKKLSVISLKTQMITLWVGLILGFIVLLKIDLGMKVILPGIVFLTFFSIILFSKKLKLGIQKLAYRFFKKNIDYPILSINGAIQVLPSFILNWILWCSAFYLFSSSLINYPIPFISSFSFALAGTLAIIAIISPGGLGIREGLLLFCLLGFGLSKQDAVTISITSRLWFLIGEIFIFTLSLILNKKSTLQ